MVRAIVLLLALVVIGCVSNTSPEGALVGQWRSTQGGSPIEFAADGTYYGGGEKIGTWKLVDGKIELNYTPKAAANIGLDMHRARYTLVDGDLTVYEEHRNRTSRTVLELKYKRQTWVFVYMIWGALIFVIVCTLIGWWRRAAARAAGNFRECN